MASRLDEFKEVFFLGASHGWAGGNEGLPLSEYKTPVDYPPGPPEIEKWRGALWREPLGFAGYKFWDCWGTDAETGLPSGCMYILHWGMPVWVMWCGGGGYEKEALPFLREALMDAYRNGQFFGGRGTHNYRKGDLLYRNHVQGDFARFFGRETVEYVGANGRQLGSHEYWGGSLVFLK